ncbi:hypothetical protein Tco_0528701 [Tanacetum coccineum]
MLLMEAKKKGTILDAEVKAFLVDVECTAPYDQPLAITTTNMFEVSHEDAYDSDVDEGPHAAATFMANLSSTSGTNGATTSQVNERKDICSIVLASDIVVPLSSNCLCEELRSNCDREHSKVVELEAEILKKQQILMES